MLFEAVTYVTAARIHSGTLIAGYDHHRARVAEYVIATVLLVAVATTWIVPAWTRRAGLAGQAFALLATLVGLFTIAIGIGPRTKLDIVYHVSIVAVLIWGLAVAKRAPEDNENRRR